MAKAKRKATAYAVEILHRRYYAGKPQRLAALEQARANDQVARKLTALRITRGLADVNWQNSLEPRRRDLSPRRR